jgi:hypothetical protein
MLQKRGFMTDKQINKFPDLTFTQFFGYDLVATFNNNIKIKELQEQLKAKEQECEKLKVENLSLKRGIEIAKEADKSWISQLKAENDELKKKCNIYTCGICGNKEDCNKLYKTLTEIKEIASREAETSRYNGSYTWKQILQKINEVEE